MTDPSPISEPRVLAPKKIAHVDTLLLLDYVIQNVLVGSLVSPVNQVDFLRPGDRVNRASEVFGHTELQF